MTKILEGEATPEDAVKQEAIHWAIKLRGPSGPEFQHEFDAWLARSSHHEAAYKWATNHFSQAAVLKQSRRYRPQSVARIPAYRLIAAAAAVIALLFFLPADPFQSSQTGSEIAFAALTFQTQRGEIHTYKLSDGSEITLDSDSEVQVDLAADKRSAALHRGKARFRVQREARPFSIAAGPAEIRTTSATLDVKTRHDGNFEVSLISGSGTAQSIFTDNEASSPPQTLGLEHSLIYPMASFAPTKIVDHRINDKDWPSGWVAYRSITIDELIRSANNYAVTQIILQDGSVGHEKLSGRFKISDPDEIARLIAQWADLKLVHKSNQIHLLPK